MPEILFNPAFAWAWYNTPEPLDDPMGPFGELFQLYNDSFAMYCMGGEL